MDQIWNIVLIIMGVVLGLVTSRLLFRGKSSPLNGDFEKNLQDTEGRCSPSAPLALLSQYC